MEKEIFPEMSDELRPEYDLSELLKGGVRGKYVERYMNLPYTLEFKPDISDPDNPVWFAAVKELRGCITEGDTFEEAAEMIKDAMSVWIQGSLDVGLPIPEPEPEQLSVQLSKSLHHDLVRSAKREGISLDQYVNVALGRMMKIESSLWAT